MSHVQTQDIEIFIVHDYTSTAFGFFLIKISRNVKKIHIIHRCYLNGSLNKCQISVNHVADLQCHLLWNGQKNSQRCSPHKREELFHHTSPARMQGSFVKLNWSDIFTLCRKIKKGEKKSYTIKGWSCLTRFFPFVQVYWTLIGRKSKYIWKRVYCK